MFSFAIDLELEENSESQSEGVAFGESQLATELKQRFIAQNIKSSSVTWQPTFNVIIQRLMKMMNLKAKASCWEAIIILNVMTKLHEREGTRGKSDLLDGL